MTARMRNDSRSRSAGNGLQLKAATQTVFFARSDRGLRQGIDLEIQNDGKPTQVKVAARIGSHAETLDLGQVPPGTTTHRIYIPDTRQAAKAEFRLLASGRLQARRVLDLKPQKHWDVYMVHLSHHDFGYTDLISNVLREHDGFMDDVLRFCDETQDWPEESKFRYVVEQAWSILHYVQNRPPEVVDRLVRLMREGRIEVAALLGNETSDLCGHEEQVRLVYPAFRLKRRFGVPIRTAQLNDVPGLSWGLVSVLAGAGVRYFAPALPDYFRWNFTVHPFWNESAVLKRDTNGAFWWEGPDGSRVLFWYGGHGAGLWTTEQTQRDMPQRLAFLEKSGYPFPLVRFGFTGGHRDNSPPDKRVSVIAREWNSRWAYPRLIVATDAQFFQALEREAGDRLPVFRGELPNTDYTVGATSTARETAVNRATHDMLPAAEKFAACASMVTDYDYPADWLAEAYDCNLLHDEHTWGMAHPIGPVQEACSAQKGEFAYRAAALAHDVLFKTTNRIVDEVALGDDGYHIVVFNPLSWSRTDVVSVLPSPPSPSLIMRWEYPKPGEDEPPKYVCGPVIGRNFVSLPASLLDKPFELIDLSSGRSVPYQVVTLADSAAARPLAASRMAMKGASPSHLKELVFVAEDVPSMGYKTYRLVPCSKRPEFPSSFRVGKSFIENRFYKVTLDRKTGAVKSIIDKELARELVDEKSAHGFNQLLVRSPVTGKVQAPARSAVAQGEAGPVLASLVVQGSGLGCPRLTQEITLYDSLKRIDFGNRLLRDSTAPLEVYFAFPFDLPKPQFRLEASNSVLEPARDQFPGSNTDTYSVQHWVAVWNDRAGVTWSSLDAPIAEVGKLWPGYVSQAHHGVTPPGYGHEFLTSPSDFKKGHVYSYAMDSNFRTNFSPFQVADVLFRYALRSHSGDWREARATERSAASQSNRGSRDFGWALANPLASVCIKGPQKGALAHSAAFCQVDQPNVVVLTIKAAEDGDGIIVRLAETEGCDSDVTISLPFLRISEAYSTNLVEEDEQVLQHTLDQVRVKLRRNGIATVRCRASRRWPEVKIFARY